MRASGHKLWLAAWCIVLVLLKSNEVHSLEEDELTLSQLSSNTSAAQLAKLGEHYLLQGKVNEAIDTLKQAVELDPSSGAPNAYLGIALLTRREQNKVEMSRSSEDLRMSAVFLSHALSVIPLQLSSEIRRYLSMALEHLNRPQEAVDMLQAYISAYPDDDKLLYCLGRHLDTLGHLDAAHDAYLDSHRQVPSAQALTRASALKTFDRTDIKLNFHLQEMEQLMQSGEVQGKDRVYLQFGLAKAYDDLKETDRAFTLLLAANKALHRMCLDSIGGLDPLAQAQGRMEALKAHFLTAGFGNPMPTKRNDPIFIVGMPRSGSTLLEKILSSHSAVTAGGEDTAFTPTVSAMMEELGLAQNELDKATVLRMHGEKYISEMRRVLEVTTPHFTDKMLDNYWQIGWIRLMIPGARIIHAVRDPVDTCLSCFKQPLEGMLGAVASDLRVCGRHLRIYREMMAHWHSVVPEGTILDMHYESLVQNQVTETRRLFDFLGLDFENQTLEFHQTSSTISTASVAQVRKPLYKSAVGRWKRYEQYIGPLLDALGDLVPQDETNGSIINGVPEPGTYKEEL